MDDFFVKPVRPGAPVAGGAKRNHDIVLDERPNAAACSPDEHRLRVAGAAAAGADDDSEDSGSDAVPKQPAGGDVMDALFTRPAGGAGAAAEPPKAVPKPASKATKGAAAKSPGKKAPAVTAAGNGLPNNGLAKALFATPGRSAPSGAGPDPGAAAEIDILFASTGKSNQPAPGPSQSGDLEEGDDSQRAGGSNLGARCLAALPALPPSLRQCRVCRLQLSMPRCSSATALRMLATATLLLPLAALTVTIATSCITDFPSVLCVAEGWMQFVVGSLPAALILSCVAYWQHRKYKLKLEAMEAAWQEDGEAQRSAASVLDALQAAPEEERVKYIQQVVQILKDFPANAVLQSKGCSAIESICRAQKGNALKVQVAGAVPPLVAAIEAHLRVRAVQHSALGALACLAKVSRQQIFDLGGISAVLASMAKFKRDSVVQVSGALILGAMCLSSKLYRKSVARYGGISLLLQILDRHVERGDVLVAACETLVLLGHDDTVALKQMVPVLNTVQGIIERYQDAGDKKAEIVLRSLRKLEAMMLNKQVPNDNDSEGSDGSAVTPRATTTKEKARVELLNQQAAVGLQDRVHKWKHKD